MNRMKYIEYIDREFESLIPGYLETKKKEQEEIWHAVDCEDFDRVMYLCERLYYSSASYAFTFIEKFSAEMRYWVTLKQQDQMKKLLEEYADYFDNLEIIYIEK